MNWLRSNLWLIHVLVHSKLYLIQIQTTKNILKLSVRLDLMEHGLDSTGLIQTFILILIYFIILSMYSISSYLTINRFLLLLCVSTFTIFISFDHHYALQSDCITVPWGSSRKKGLLSYCVPCPLSYLVKIWSFTFGKNFWEAIIIIPNKQPQRLVLYCLLHTFSVLIFIFIAFRRSRYRAIWKLSHLPFILLT